MMRHYRDIIFALILNLLALNINAQVETTIKWQTLGDGLFFAEIDAPEKSILNDSKLSILKIDPNEYTFKLLLASEYERKTRTAVQWANEFDLNVVVNLGMYQYDNIYSAKAFCVNYKHVNNSRFSSYYNAILAFNPVEETNNKQFEIIDLTCNGWEKIRNKYKSFCQGLRMIDCEGNPIEWNRNPDQSCSMVIASTDKEGNVYLIFSRSPYTHQKMISFLLSLPLNLTTTVYLEGGPEASLYVSTHNTTISKFGSYISKVRERDDNPEFWKIPNVIGISKRK